MSKVLEKWQELRVLIESMELDVHKNSNGNASAGVRARKGLRALKSAASELVKITIEEEKTDWGKIALYGGLVVVIALGGYFAYKKIKG